MIARRDPTRRRGTTLPEVLVAAGMVLVVILVLLTMLPRSRENARLVGCSGHLGRIGQALAQYDAAVGHLPLVPATGEPGRGLLATLADGFGLPFFDGGAAARAPLPSPVEPRMVAGFLCPSDPNGLRPDPFPAPVSYRANAGPGADGRGGPFSPGELGRMADAEANAGRDYTAAFAERLLGGGVPGEEAPNNYQLAPGPLGPEPCPVLPRDRWRGDAGTNWAEAGWASTLYNHAMTPDASPSCIAEDGKTARMGASSGHAGRVHVLMLGGSVRGFAPTVSPKVWRTFGAVSNADR